MEGHGPQNGHTDLLTHIQQAAHIGDIYIVDAQHVAVIIVHNALAVGRALITHQVKAQGL